MYYTFCNSIAMSLSGHLVLQYSGVCCPVVSTQCLSIVTTLLVQFTIGTIIDHYFFFFFLMIGTARRCPKQIFVIRIRLSVTSAGFRVDTRYLPFELTICLTVFHEFSYPADCLRLSSGETQIRKYIRHPSVQYCNVITCIANEDPFYTPPKQIYKKPSPNLDFILYSIFILHMSSKYCYCYCCCCC